MNEGNLYRQTVGPSRKWTGLGMGAAIVALLAATSLYLGYAGENKPEASPSHAAPSFNAATDSKSKKCPTPNSAKN